MWMSNCLWNTLIRNAVMYLISHPLMVLPLLRITQGRKGWGWGHGGIAREEGAVTEALRKRKQDLGKTEGEREKALKSCSSKGREGWQRTEKDMRKREKCYIYTEERVRVIKTGVKSEVKKHFQNQRENLGFTEKKGECHFTIWNACIQIRGRSFGAQRMQLYLHCHIPLAWIRGKDTLANPIVELGSFIKVKERWI